MDPITSLPVGGRTRKELRRMIGTRLGDLKVLRATSDSASPSIFVDGINLIHSSDFYAGRIAYFCGGQANLLGQQVSVASSSAQNRTLTFNDALPASPLTGDELHLVNWSGAGFIPDDYHQTMNDSILAITDSHYYLPMAIDVELSYDSASNSIQIPSQMRIVENVQWLSVCGDWVDVKKSRQGAYDGWSIDRPTGRIMLPRSSRTTALDMRITGYGDQPLLTVDSDLCQIPVEWFIEECAARLLEKSIQKNPGLANQDRVYNQLRQHADAIRPITSVRMGPFAERVYY